MLFSDVRIKELEYVVRYNTQKPRWQATQRKNHIIGIKLSGRAEHIFADRRFTIEENCIYFLNQEEDYRVENSTRGMAFSIHFTTYEPIGTKSFCIQMQYGSNIARFLEAVEHSLKRGNVARALSEFYRLLDAFEEIYEKKYHPKNAALPTAQKYLLAHFAEKGCIAKAAALYGVSQRRFCDVFKETYHVTPNRFLINHKLEIAKKLLVSEEIPLSEIAELSGFADAYYFSKLFKKEVGISPTKYRRTE